MSNVAKQDLSKKYGKLSDISDSIDELVAETSLGANRSSRRRSEQGSEQGSGQGSEFSRFDDLFKPFPEIKNLTNVRHQADQSEEESKAENAQVSKAIVKVDEALEKRRVELGLQLDYLGVSDWKERLNQYESIEDLSLIHI